MNINVIKHIKVKSLLFVCYCLLAYACRSVYEELRTQPEDPILSIYCVGPRDGIQFSGLVARTFTHGDISMALNSFKFN